MENELWDVEFRLSVSRRYCSQLESHYVFLDKLTILVNLLGGSTVIVDVLNGFPSLPLAEIGSILVVVMSLVAVVFNWSEKARHYRSQKVSYVMLLERLQRAGKKMPEDQLDKLKADFSVVEAEDFEPKKALAALCHNHECNYRNLKDYKVKLYFWQKWLAKWVSLPPSSWE